MGDTLRALRGHQQDIRARRRSEAPRILAQHDVGFVAYSDGAHLRVRGVFDFWPGTARWVHVQTREQGFGIFALLRRLGVATDAKDLDE